MITFGHLLHSEWTKFRSLRSTWLTVLTTAVLGIGISALATRAQGLDFFGATAEDQAKFDPTAISLTSIILAQLAIGVLGVLVVTSEYATGMIQPSVTAVPRRGRLLAAKALVFTGVGLAVGELIGFTSFFIGQSILSDLGAPHAALDDPGVLRAVIGCGLYLAVLGLLGLALGTLVRSTAGAISLLITLTLLIRMIALALPAPLRDWISKYWPTTAGRRSSRYCPIR
jgi:ABC-2 type transport system permease protein